MAQRLGEEYNVQLKLHMQIHHRVAAITSSSIVVLHVRSVTRSSKYEISKFCCFWKKKSIFYALNYIKFMYKFHIHEIYDILTYLLMCIYIYIFMMRFDVGCLKKDMWVIII